MSASLGGLLKDYRLQKNIPQMEIAFALGWKDTSRLSRIEQGVIEKPPRERIDEICRAMKLSEQETNTLLLTGNYVPVKEELDAIRSAHEVYLETLPYAVFMYDFCWRIILINTKAMKMLGMDEPGRQEMYKQTPSAIELLFDPNFIQNTHLTGKELDIWHVDLLRFLVHFKSLHTTILKDKMYLGVMKRMMSNELFRDLWKKSQRSDVHFITTRFGKKIFVHPHDHTQRLNFNIFVMPLLKDPRFELEFFTPRDSATTEFFQG